MCLQIIGFFSNFHLSIFLVIIWWTKKKLDEEMIGIRFWDSNPGKLESNVSTITIETSITP